jgi:hypothetical protein
MPLASFPLLAVPTASRTDLTTNASARYEAGRIGRRDDVPITDKRIVGHDMLIGLRAGVREQAQPMSFSRLLTFNYAFYPNHLWGVENMVPGISDMGPDGIVYPPLCMKIVCSL